MSSASLHDPRIVSLYQYYRVDRSVSTYVRRVADHYSVPTLERLATRGRAAARRAAVLALGVLGDYGSNAVLGRALIDSDRGVRMLAEVSIRKVWCRVGNTAQRHSLRMAVRLNETRRYQQAVQETTKLIHQTPWLAEAWNQRGLGYFYQGDYDAALRDLHQALQINPYHFSVAATMGRCYIKQNDGLSALNAFRRALQLNPNMEEVRVEMMRLRRRLKED